MEAKNIKYCLQIPANCRIFAYYSGNKIMPVFVKKKYTAINSKKGDQIIE
jgi:hypothetical protein